jgi:hypothetical protein
MTELEIIKITIGKLKTLGFANQRTIGKALGYSNESSFSQVVNGKVSLPSDFFERVYKLHPDIENYANSLKNDESIKKINPTVEIKETVLIPFFGVDFMNGKEGVFGGENLENPEYYLDIPDFRGCIAFRSHWDCADKLIKVGSILFVRKIEDWKSHLEYGKIYGIICTDDRRYLKRIRLDKQKPKTHFLLCCENEFFDPFSIPKNKIKTIWLLEGLITRTS